MASCGLGSETGNGILFRDLDGVISAMDADGNNVRQLLNTEKYDAQPVWSPDGEHIAFVESIEGLSEGVFVMDADGTNVKRITIAEASYSDPSWVQGGRGVAFVSDRDGDNEIVQILDWESTLFYVDHSNVFSEVPSISITNNLVHERNPSWSPDGEFVVFISERSGYAGIFVADATGENERRLLEDDKNYMRPTWSPAGDSIAFIADLGSGSEIFAMSVDGSNVRQITDNTTSDFYPVWSPDGKYIAFTHSENGNR